MLLIHRTDAGLFRQGDFVAVSGQLTQDQLEQGGFADAVAADQPHLGAGRQADRGVLQKGTAPGVEGQVVDLEHWLGQSRETPSSSEAQRAERQGRKMEKRASWKPAAARL